MTGVRCPIPSPDNGTGRVQRADDAVRDGVLRSPSGATARMTSSPTLTLSESPSRATSRLSTLSTSGRPGRSGSRPRGWRSFLRVENTTVDLDLLGLLAARKSRGCW